MISLNRIILFTAAFSLMLTQTGCLKTRAQLREEGEDERGITSQAAPSKAPQDVQPQGQYVIDEIKGEFTRLEGRVEDMERAQKQQASAAKSDEVKKLETRITELEQAQANMLEVIKKLQETPAASADPAELLQKGRNQVEAGNFEGAIENLTAYMKNPKGKKSEEATLLRAEAYFSLKDYKKAIVDYSKFPEKFTRSTHMPLALLRIGKSFEALGMKDDAKGFYQELVEKFPKSPEAKKVKTKIK